MTREIIYYSDGRGEEAILQACRDQLKKSGLKIINCSLIPLDFADVNIHLLLVRGYETYFRQIIRALEASTADIVFFAEHDVLYHPSYFEFTPEKQDTFYYNQNVFRWKFPQNYGVMWDANQVAELSCNRELALNWYHAKLKQYLSEKFDRKFEPEDKFETWRSKEPNIDIRHWGNLTKSKWSLADFRDKRTAINFQEGSLPEWAKGIIGGEK